MKQKEADELLPSQATEAKINPLSLVYLMIGPVKWGKTTFGCDADDSILLATEQGHMFHKTRKIIIDVWEYLDREDRDERLWVEDDDGNTHASMVAACETIAASSKYKFIILDTADMAAKMCQDYHYAKFRVSHASDAGEWGKGWDITLTQPFRKAINILLKSGRGVFLITHLKVVTKKIGKEEISRYETTLPSMIQHYLQSQADVILHGTFGKRRKGLSDRDRIIVTDGSNEIMAGSRVRGIRLPNKYIVDPEHPFQQWAGFFDDEDTVEKAEEDYKQLVLKGRESEDEDKPIEEPTQAEESPNTRAGKAIESSASNDRAARRAERTAARRVNRRK